jgi:hypothetical protein
VLPTYMAPKPQNVLPKLNAKLERASVKRLQHRKPVLSASNVDMHGLESGRATKKAPAKAGALKAHSDVSSDLRAAVQSAPQEPDWPVPE